MSPIKFSLTPEISVILCTYNRANYLSQCIESVINQTYEDWEFIIVDDGSQDNTFEIVNSYLEKNPKIRYLKHQNCKLAFSKNAGIQTSFGRYITFIDSDDQYKKNHLQSRIEYMKNYTDVDLIQGGFITEEQVWVADYYQPAKLINIQDCVLGPTFFGKRKVFFELEGFNNIAYGEDTDLWERAEKKFMTKTLKEPATYVYTRAETSISKDFSEGIG
ncbi:MAG: glycosyltransferase family A protein [Crocosphaera sp.]|nr:glycosyltransferase family A protein [Crocosphaera sp.]